MLFVALGATDAIGASCLFLKVAGTGLVLDAGADPEEEGLDSLPRFDLIHRNPGWYVDHALITHAHHDHVGALPVLVQQFPHVLVHMTPATRDLIDFALPASARLQVRKRREGSTTAEPLFSEDEVEYHSYLYLTHRLETPFDVTGLRGEAPVKATFYDAGHLLGSAGILLEFEDDGAARRVFYSSDTSMRPQTIIPGGSYPAGPVDVLVLESTLGADPNAEQTTRKTEEKRFREAIQRILGRGGTVLIPVFAMGRAQEVIALLARFKERGYIAEDVPIYTAGGLRAVSDLYDKARFATPRLDPEFLVFGVEQRRLPRSQDAKLNALQGPSIHVVSSGMMFERTLSNWMAQHLVEDEKNGVLLVGFAKEDTPAHRLRMAAEHHNGSDSPSEVVLDPLKGPQSVRAEVQRIRLSGHSHRRDLIQLVEQLRPKKVLLVHGEEPARRWLADNIRYFYPEVEIVLPQVGESLEV